MAEAGMDDVVQRYEELGYTGSFWPAEGGRLVCGQCQKASDAHEIHLDALHRVEGTSDPDEMAAVTALTCPSCGHKGTCVVPFGTEMSAEDAAVLSALQDHRRNGPVRSGR